MVSSPRHYFYPQGASRTKGWISLEIVGTIFLILFLIPALIMLLLVMISFILYLIIEIKRLIIEIKKQEKENK